LRKVFSFLWHDGNERYLLYFHDVCWYLHKCVSTVPRLDCLRRETEQCIASPVPFPRFLHFVGSRYQKRQKPPFKAVPCVQTSSFRHFCPLKSPWKSGKWKRSPHLPAQPMGLLLIASTPNDGGNACQHISTPAKNARS